MRGLVEVLRVQGHADTKSHTGTDEDVVGESGITTVVDSGLRTKSDRVSEMRSLEVIPWQTT